MKNEPNHGQWYRLDNAAMIYSAIQRSDYSAVYRFSAVMTKQVNPKILQRAVDKTMPRFPGVSGENTTGIFLVLFRARPTAGAGGAKGHSQSLPAGALCPRR